jgi:predicted MFS family arabinose efflux permease
LQLVTLLMTVFMLPESHSKPADDDEKVGLRDVFATFRNPAMRPILLQKAALSMSLYGWYLVIALYFKAQLGFGLIETFYAFSAFALIGVFMNVVAIGKVSKRTGDYRMANWGVATLAVGFALVPFVHAIWAMAVVMVLFAFGQSLGNAGITAQISNTASKRDQGTVLGVSSSLDSAAGITSPLLSTGIFSRFGSGYAGTEPLAFALLGLAFGIFLPHRAPNHESKEATADA